MERVECSLQVVDEAYELAVIFGATFRVGMLQVAEMHGDNHISPDSCIC